MVVACGAGARRGGLLGMLGEGFRAWCGGFVVQGAVAGEGHIFSAVEVSGRAAWGGLVLVWFRLSE